MPPAIPAPLASYLESSLSCPCSQILITSVLSTPSPWLLLRLVYASLYGVEDDNEIGRNAGAAGSSGDFDRPVVFISLLRPLTLWIEMGKKMGLDLSALIRDKRIIYLDGLAYGTPFSGPADASKLPTTKINAMTLDGLQTALMAAFEVASGPLSDSPSSSPLSSTKSTPRTATPSKEPTSTASNDLAFFFLVDGLDFLLASQPSLSTLTLQSFLSGLMRNSNVLALTWQADAHLVQIATAAHNDSGTPLERNHAHFLTWMAHRSRWVFQLRGLDTGSAKDVSGVLRVSRGGAAEDEYEIEDRKASAQQKGAVEKLPDAEWLYQLKGDGSLRVWGRGE